jgi:hypothetical protein
MWCRPGHNSATLREFFAELGDRKDSIRAVSIDMGTATGRWVKGTRWSLLKAPANQSIYQLVTLAEVQRQTAVSTAPSLCARRCGCSTTTTIPASRPSISTPGRRGRHARGCGPSSASRARCASTATRIRAIVRVTGALSRLLPSGSVVVLDRTPVRFLHGGRIGDRRRLLVAP